MINSITIKGVASYCPQGITIETLGKINFIYGANGCGKTTISNYLLDPSSHKYRYCTHSWRQNSETEILVYNKEFRERNFGEGNVKGIFTLGEATKEDVDFVENKSSELKDQKKILAQRKETFEIKEKEKSVLEENFKENAWLKVFKKHENTYKAAFVGVMGKKDSFRSKLLEQSKNNVSELLSSDVLIEKAKTVFSSSLVEKPIFEEVDVN